MTVMTFQKQVLYLNCSSSKENVNINSKIGVNEIFDIGALISATLDLLQLQYIAGFTYW